MNNDKISALIKTYDLIVWIIPVLNKFPNSQKYLLANKIEMSLLEIMELIIEAVYSKEKKKYLYSANMKIEKTRYLIRISKDLKFLPIKKYEYISKGLNDIGIELGAWIKYVNA